MTRVLPVAAVAALLLSVGAQAAIAQDFRASARQDLQAARDELAENHPAPAVGGAAAQTFSAWLDQGLQDALGKAGQATSGSSHAYLLRYYAAGFRDANIIARASYDTPETRFTALSWPGVTTGWRNGQYVVTHVRPGTRTPPPVGAVVVSCGERPIEEFARAKLDLWEGDLNTEAGRAQTAPYLLWNRNNPFTGGMGVPSVCTFKVGRRERDYNLYPTPIVPAELEAAYRATVYSPGATPLSIETVNGRPWVNIHSFADEAGWDVFNTQLAEQAATLRGPQGLVLDLRGAAGASALGSSARGYGTVNRIWTPEFAQSVQPQGVDFTYRATADNRQWYATVIERMKQDARFVYESPQVIAQTEAILAGFDAALAAGQATFTLPAAASTVTAGANPVQGPVIVLVDSSCGGGCLDTVDLLSRLPNVRIAGSTTPADSVFIEQTVHRLPSNYADLSYGHKAWLGRERGNNQPHAPAGALAYTGNPTDEAAVRTWVGGLFGG